MTAESEGDNPKLVTREQFYPVVGSPTDALKALAPTFTEQVMEGVISALNQGAKRVELELIHSGDNPQTLKVRLEKDGAGDNLRFTYEGDWREREKTPVGLPLIANFSGAFFRKFRPEDPLPIADKDSFIEPDGALGVASSGKGNYWVWRLPPAEFPDGGRVTEFRHPDGEDVEPGMTVICFVEKL